MNRSVPCLPRHEIEERGDCVTIRFRRADYVPLRGKWDAVIERKEPILALLDGTEDGVALREIFAGFELAPREKGTARRGQSLAFPSDALSHALYVLPIASGHQYSPLLLPFEPPQPEARTDPVHVRRHCRGVPRIVVQG